MPTDNTVFISLAERIQFKEIGLNGSTGFQEYARVGMYESTFRGAGFRIDLRGQLSEDIDGRLLIGNDSCFRFEVSDHGYEGTFSLFAFDEENQISTLIGNYSVIDGFIEIPINTLFEKDAVFSGYILPNNLVYHHFFHLVYNQCELMVNNVLTSIPNSFSIINDINDAVMLSTNDYLSTFISLNISANKTVKALLKSSSVIQRPSIGDNEEAEESIGGLSFFKKNQTDISITGKVFYGNYLYENCSTLSGAITSLQVLVPSITRYYNEEGPSYHVLNVYFPHDVLHNMSDSSYKASAILYVHGGSWSSSSNAPFTIGKEEAIDEIFEGKAVNCEERYLSSLLSRGFIVVSMEYNGIDIGNNYNCQTMLDDIHSAIAYLTNNSIPMHIDNSKLCLWGHSAGGHLALMYAYTRNYSINNLIKLVIAEGTPFTFEGAILDENIKRMRGNQTIEEVSPKEYAGNFPNPLSFFVCGTNDPITSYLRSSTSDLDSIFGSNEYIIVTPQCDHNGYSFSIDNVNNELSSILDWYKNL